MRWSWAQLGHKLVGLLLDQLIRPLQPPPRGGGSASTFGPTGRGGRPAGTPTAGRACQSPLAESYWVAVAPTRAALDGARRARSPGVTCDTGVRPAHRVRSVRCRRLNTAPAPAHIPLRKWRRRRRAEGRLRGAQLYRASWLSPPLAPPGLSEETVGAHGRARSWLKCAVTV